MDQFTLAELHILYKALVLREGFCLNLPNKNEMLAAMTLREKIQSEIGARKMLAEEVIIEDSDTQP